MTRKLSLSDLISKSLIAHGDAYDYAKTTYTPGQKSTITCKIHGDFQQDLSLHARGHSGCRECAKDKRAKSCLEKFGTKNPFQSAEIKEKIKETMLDRWGVENPAHSDTINEKRKNTCLSIYGSEHAVASEAVQDKIRQTCEARYGVQNVGQSAEIQTKIQATCLERYGSRSFLGSSECIERTRDYYMREFGIAADNISTVDNVDAIKLLSDKNWLLDQYVERKKTAEAIAREVGVCQRTVLNYMASHGIATRYNGGWSYKAVSWLEHVAAKDGIFIQHALNVGEFKIPNTKLRVDGYCRETNTAYEFYGDIFHGNPNRYTKDDRIFPFNRDITAGDLYEKTVKKEKNHTRGRT